MSLLKRIVSPFLCCFGVGPREETATSDLQTLPSALHLPASQIPHAANHSRSGRTDTDALRELFRTSSSIRGYRTASIPSGSHLQRDPSFDAEFKFGSQEQHPKQPGRLEQIGKHIKQRLSESGLSKSSSRVHVASEDISHELNRSGATNLDKGLPAVSPSQRSTGLFDLLQSRTASEGGYDSDAKSIHTAMLNSREGTMKLSPHNAPAFLPPSIDLRHIATDGAPPSLDFTLPAQVIAPQADADDSISLMPRSSITHVVPESQHDSTSFVLKQSHPGDAGGTIEVLDTSKPEKAFPFPTLQTEEQDPFTTSPSVGDHSSTHPDRHFVELLKKPADTGSAIKRESLISNLTDPRASLVSNLDPSLLDFISRYGEDTSTGLAKGSPGEHQARAIVDPQSDALQASIPDIPSMFPRENTSKRDLSSIAESERNSVHLYNMRISRHLGSLSVVDVASRPNTSHTANQAPRDSSTEGRLSFGRPSTSGTMTGQITAEHNRRPSDPHTRRLFEGEKMVSRPPPTRKYGTSLVESAANKKPMPLVNTDDASSFYGSDGEVGSSGPSRHRTCKRNPNSIAIGGRSESISLPVDSSSASIGGLSVAEESAWFGRKSSQQNRRSEEDNPVHRSAKRNRSVSMPTEAADHDQARRALHTHRVQHPTETNETMSEISIDHLQDAKREQMTEISEQAIRGSRNERMSEIGPLDLSSLIAIETRPELTSAWSDAGPSTLEPELSVGEKRSVSMKKDPAESTLSSRPKFLETTTNLWQRSFRKALDEPQNGSLGGFLTAPKFDRDGRRRSTRSSISVAQPPRDHRRSDAEADPLEFGGQHESFQPKEKTRLEVCMKKPELPLSVDSRRSIAIIETRRDFFNTYAGPKTLQRKNLLSIGRRLSVPETSHEPEHGSGANTPLKDLFGLWGRFPSHARENRCASAGAKDGVAVRDFALECHDENSTSCSAAHQRSATALEFHTPGSWKMLSFGKKDRSAKGKTKNAGPLHTVRATQSLGRRQKKGRQGLAGRLKRLYRTSSMDFQAYTQNYGHRSSIGLGAGVQYPELEVVPGSPGWRSNLDGIVETDNQHRREVSDHSLRHLQQPLDTAPWTQTYRDCVGSLSALKSDPELRRSSLDDEPGPVHARRPTLGGLSSAEMRDSTVDFKSQLGKENEAATEGLTRKVESMQLAHA